MSNTPPAKARMKTLTEQIVVRVEPDLKKWLDEYATEDGRTTAQTVRWLLQGVKDGRWEFRG